ncbi:ran guanine nucleotide release factor [Phyllobates terribilis]|uniref:ran guanine nucleotide release factor n=1 Tax=Phyllobates terribilis TaxID=111132 RepID=UPI003CCAD938
MEGASDQRPLFGGAMSAVLPPSVQDVSDLREIPDNQEVFVHPRTDQSIVVELLEYQWGVSDPDAARYHFEDVAASNDAEGRADVLTVEPLPLAQLSLTRCSGAWTLTGHQIVSKFSKRAQNTVMMHMGLLRIQQHNTDLLVTFNDPVLTDAASSSIPVPGASDSPVWTVDDFRRLLCSLRLHDPGLFG